MTTGIPRRSVVKGIAAVGALATFIAGYGSTLRKLARGWWVGRKPAHAVYGDPLEPEARVSASGTITPNEHLLVAQTVCHGCTTLCGVRAVVDARDGTVLRALGNPYHPLSNANPIAYATPVRESLRAFTPAGQAQRGTMCARGNDAFEKARDPARVRAVLKRAGPRGSGQWRTIPFEQAVREIVDGGTPFASIGEHRVIEGLRALRDTETLIDPGAPELGARANQLGFMAAFDDGRQALLQRFTRAFGTVNFWAHRGSCALTLRAGYAAFLDDWQRQPHLKPDYEHCEFALFFGTSPGHAGNPFKRQGQLVGAARADGHFRYAVVDPVQHTTDSLAAGDRAEWIPIRPGTDAALALGIARWIFEQERFDANYLSIPNVSAAEAAHEPSCSGATWLVVTEPGHERDGAYLRASDLWIGGTDEPIVADPATGMLVAASRCERAALFHGGVAPMGGQPVRVRTALSLYRGSAMARTLAEYAQICGVPERKIAALARELTSHGKHVAVDAHGGTMHAGGFHAAWAAVALNGLVGNVHWKGGTFTGGGRFADFADGPRYDLATIAGAPKARGMKLTREHDYRDTSEYRRKGFPAQAAWHPFGRALQGEVLAAALDGYPYRLRALISFNANPLYGAAGLEPLVRDRLRDPAKLPLIVAVDPFVNETSLYADYLFPDAAMYETWGVAPTWGGVPGKVSSTRYPVVDPPTPRTAVGEPLDGDTFIIELAIALGLPGFGAHGIPASDGSSLPLTRPADYYLRAFANVAYDGAAVPDVSAEDARLTGVDTFLARHRGLLTAEEERKVAFVLSRGGRYQDAATVWRGESLTRRYARPVQFYSEQLARTPNSQTGVRYAGVPTYELPRGSNGGPLEAAFGEWPLKLVAYKSQTHSSMHPGTRIAAIRPRNFIELGPDDAARAGVVHGGSARIETPGGSAQGTVRVRHGIAPGVVAVEHGFGHWAFGCEERVIDGAASPILPLRGAGIALNRIAPRDPTTGGASLLTDEVTGANARTALPARVVPA
jgi:tetrathionate reductase subunit A